MLTKYLINMVKLIKLFTMLLFIFSICMILIETIIIISFYYVAPYGGYDMIIYVNDKCIRTNVTIYNGECWTFDSVFRLNEYVVETFLHLNTNKTFSGLYRDMGYIGLGASERNASNPGKIYCWNEFNKNDIIGEEISCAIQKNIYDENKLFMAPRFVIWSYLLIGIIIIVSCTIITNLCSSCCTLMYICNYIFTPRINRQQKITPSDMDTSNLQIPQPIYPGLKY